MILSFKKQFPWGEPTNFKEKILSGTKIHSIRDDKTARWKPGMQIHMAYGVRTKFYECFNKNNCKSKQYIYIVNNEKIRMVGIDDSPNGPGDLFYMNNLESGDEAMRINVEILAKNDGFDSVDDFFKWFHSDFKGVIIHWTDFRY